MPPSAAPLPTLRKRVQQVAAWPLNPVTRSLPTTGQPAVLSAVAAGSGCCRSVLDMVWRISDHPATADLKADVWKFRHRFLDRHAELDVTTTRSRINICRRRQGIGTGRTSASGRSGFMATGTGTGDHARRLTRAPLPQVMSATSAQQSAASVGCGRRMIQISANKVLSKPWRTTRKYYRQRAQKFDIAEGVCAQGAFTDAVDKNGNAIFAPVQFHNGVPVGSDSKWAGSEAALDGDLPGGRPRRRLARSGASSSSPCTSRPRP